MATMGRHLCCSDLVQSLSRRMENTVKYLRVDYHDNDFGGLVEQALVRIWKCVHDNNAHCLRSFPRSDHFAHDTVGGVLQKVDLEHGRVRIT